MNVTNLIGGAAAGFASGFCVGLYNPVQKREDQLDIIEIALSKDEREKKDLGDLKLSRLRAKSRRLNYSTPFLPGALCFFVSSAGQYNDLEAIAAIPASYLGYWAGRAISREKNSKHREITEDLKVLRRMRDNPKTIESYLSEEAKGAINEALIEAEQKLLKGEEEDFKHSAAMKKMYDSLIKTNKVYTRILLQWSLDRMKAAIEGAVLEREIRKFYEESMPTPNAISCRFIGDSGSEMKARVFKREGDELYTQNYEWKNLSLVERDASPFVEVSISGLQVTNLKQEPWTNDYIQLAREVIKEKENSGDKYTFMLMRVPVGTPQALQNGIVTESVVSRVISARRKRIGGKN